MEARKPASQQSLFVADLETTTEEPKPGMQASAWLWDICSLGPSYTHVTGYDMDSLIEYLLNKGGNHYFFHNLAFDGAFIVDWLLKHGYQHSTERIDKKEKQGYFSTLISDTGVWYSVRIHFKGASKLVYLEDSLKLLTMKVGEMPAAFGLVDKDGNEFSKGEIDYNRHNNPLVAVLPEEVSYCQRDTEIVARSLDAMFLEGMSRTKKTAASCALKEYQDIVTMKDFDRWFPEDAESDRVIRKAYRGGWVYVNPKYKGKKVGAGRVFDVNSHFPAQLRYQPMPWGKPIYFKGRYPP